MPALIYPALLAMLLLFWGAAAAWWMVAFNIALVPLLDSVIKRAWPGQYLSQRVLDFLFAAPWFWVYAGAQAAALIYALHWISTQAPSPLAFMGLVSGVGLMTGTAGITAAHELIHRPARSARALGLALLAMVTYLHFRIEHVYGHHRQVGTSKDPASAEIDQDFPGFFARSLARGVAGAWRIEAAQRRRRGLRVFAIGNRMLHYCALQLTLCALILVVFGAQALLLFLLQSLVAVHLLEAVNYVQHYGLHRRADQPVDEIHSWDSDDPVSGLLVFHLNRHAQHHLDPRRPAAALGVAAQAPRLPYSFFLMVFLALLPPVWKRLMRPRLTEVSSPGAQRQRVAAPAGAAHA